MNQKLQNILLILFLFLLLPFSSIGQEILGYILVPCLFILVNLAPVFISILDFFKY